MSIAARLPTMTLPELTRLHENATRLAGGPEGKARDQAAELLPLLDERLAAAVGSDPACAGLAVQVVRSDGAVGGGCAPEVPLPGWAVEIPVETVPRLRRPEGEGVAVVARVDELAQRYPDAAVYTPGSVL